MIESKVQMLGLLESNINTPLQTVGFLTLYNQSSLEDKMNEPIFYIKVPAVTEKEKKEEKNTSRNKGEVWDFLEVIHML